MATPGKNVIVMAVDDSTLSMYCLDWYIKYLHKPENYVTLVHVPEHFDVEKAQKELAKGGQMKESMEKVYSKITELEERYNHKLHSAKVEGRILSIPNKSAGHTIVETAKEENAFAIVMGTRGLSKVKKAILGSVSDHVVQKSEIPVIVVRKKDC